MAFFVLFTRKVEDAGAKKAFADALARAGVDVKAATAAAAQVVTPAASTDELDLVESVASDIGTTARVRLRVRRRLSQVTQPSDFGDGQATVRDVALSYKAGIPMDDVVTAGRMALASEQVALVGLHSHLGRHSTDLEVWRAASRSFAELVAELHRAWDGWIPEERNVGRLAVAG